MYILSFSFISDIYEHYDLIVFKNILLVIKIILHDSIHNFI